MHSLLSIRRSRWSDCKDCIKSLRVMLEWFFRAENLWLTFSISFSTLMMDSMIKGQSGQWPKLLSDVGMLLLPQGSDIRIPEWSEYPDSTCQSISAVVFILGSQSSSLITIQAHSLIVTRSTCGRTYRVAYRNIRSQGKWVGSKIQVNSSRWSSGGRLWSSLILASIIAGSWPVWMATWTSPWNRQRNTSMVSSRISMAMLSSGETTSCTFQHKNADESVDHLFFVHPMFILYQLVAQEYINHHSLDYHHVP